MINKYEIYTMYTVLPRSILHPHSELVDDLELVHKLFVYPSIIYPSVHL